MGKRNKENKGGCLVSLIWVFIAPAALAMRWRYLSIISRITGIVWTIVALTSFYPYIYFGIGDKSAPTQSPEVLENIAIDTILTRENYLENFVKAVPLPEGSSFSDRKNGISIKNSDEPSNKDDATQLTLTVDVGSMAKENLLEVVFRISEAVYKIKRNFEITHIHISLLDKDGNEFSDWENFMIGINTLNKFYESKGDLTPEGLFSWIEQHFQLPEDDNWLLENDSWTTLSEKSKP